MSSPLILQELLRSLAETAKKLEPSPLQAAFLSWLYGDPEPLSAATQIDASEPSYVAAAYLGFKLVIAPSQELEVDFLTSCQRQVEREIRRSNGDLQAFALDPLALLGMVVGAQSVPQSDLTAKLYAQISHSLEAGDAAFNRESEKRSFADACISLIKAVPEITKTASPGFVFVLLSRTGFALDASVGDQAFDEISAAAFGEIGPFTSSIYLRALELLLAQTSTFNSYRPTVEAVAAVLKGVGSGLLRWPYGRNKNSTWEIQNEYDVQSLLFFLLKPLFPELKEEENLPSVGTKKPRVDLAIPSLRLLIEVKFIRTATKFAAVIGELAEDKSLYLTSASAYSQILAFVWDDSARTEEHHSIIQAAADLGLAGAIVVSRPTFMNKS